MAKLTAKDRNKLPSSSFALPGKGEGKSGKGSGSYPIPDRSHAANALARSSAKDVHHRRPYQERDDADHREQQHEAQIKPLDVPGDRPFEDAREPNYNGADQHENYR
jgi:hypothetical protein